MKSKTLWCLNIIHTQLPARKNKRKKYQNNALLALSLINQYNYTEYKSTKKKIQHIWEKENVSYILLYLVSHQKQKSKPMPFKHIVFLVFNFLSQYTTIHWSSSLVSSTLLPCSSVNYCHVDWILVTLPNAIILEWHISYMKALQKPIMSTLGFLFFFNSCKVLLLFPWCVFH